MRLRGNVRRRLLHPARTDGVVGGQVIIDVKEGQLQWLGQNVPLSSHSSHYRRSKPADALPRNPETTAEPPEVR